MELSIFLAKTWGIFIIIVCSSLLLNATHFKRLIRHFDNEVLILYGGILAVGIGIPLVLAYNYWSFDWKVLITILGWATLLKGVYLLLFPEHVKKLANVLATTGLYQFALILYTGIGLLLSYEGFSH